MNNDTNTIDECSNHLECMGRSETELHGRVDDEVQWTCLKVLALCHKQAPAASMGSPSQMILYLSNTYDGPHAERFAMLCNGLYLMSKRRFRRALREFSAVLLGRVDPEFELFREVTLQAHTFCLEQLDYDEDALEDFTALLVEKFGETRDYGEADHVSRLLGLSGTRRGEPRRMAFEC